MEGSTCRGFLRKELSRKLKYWIQGYSSEGRGKKKIKFGIVSNVIRGGGMAKK